MMTIDQWLLLKLMEESGETAQRASKAMQFGLAEQQSPEHLDNASRIMLEYIDQQAVMELLEERGTLKQPGHAAELKHAKKQKLLKYLAYSQALGFVEGGKP